MKLTIEIKDETNVDKNNLFNPSGFPSTGIFNVDGWVYIVNKELNLVSSVCGFDQFLNASNGKIQEEEPIKFGGIFEERTVSESFVLKLLAINAGKVNNVDLNGQSFKLAE